MDIAQLTTQFRGAVAQLPSTWGEQVLIDKIGARLPGWKGRLLTRAGRLALVNSVLASVPVYHMTSFPLSKWAITRIDRIRRKFLWTRRDDPRRGHCPVSWTRVCRAKHLGGLGIKDLACFNRALRLRWPWLKWKDPTKPSDEHPTHGS
jgi:hypothetical protein